MSSPNSPEALVRIGCGAFIGLSAGFIIVAATLSFYTGSMEIFVVIGLSTATCAVLAWRVGDRIYRSLSRWIRKF